MHLFILLAAIGLDHSPLPLEKRVDAVESEIVTLKRENRSLRNDVEALKRMADKCDVASKAPDPKPASKCPDGVCADCKCKLGDECGCLKLSKLLELPSTATPVVQYRQVCNGGVCQLVPVDATDETPQVVMQQRNSYSSPCANGSCGVSRTRRGLFGRRR